jgi:hypothetical protein
MKIGDLVLEKHSERYGIIIFVDDDDPDCFGVLFIDTGRTSLWDLGWSEDLEVVNEEQ